MISQLRLSRDESFLRSANGHVPNSLNNWRVSRVSVRKASAKRGSVARAGLTDHRPPRFHCRASPFIYRHLASPELHPDSLKWGKNKTCMSILPLGTRPWVNSVRGKRGEGQQGSREASPTNWDWSVCGRFPNEKKDRR